MFSWFENVGNGSSPLTLSILITFYSALTITFMFLFGCKTWLEKGDVFSVYYHIMGSFGIFNISQNQNLKISQISLRLPVLGLAKLKTPTIPFVIFHIILLGTISFDGLSETSLWSKIEILIIPSFGRIITESFGIIIIPTLFFILLWIICWVISVITKEKTPETIITSLIFSLTPIAIAYHIAHYLSYILITWQLIIQLISDPFCFVWNIFGTADYSLNIDQMEDDDSFGFINTTPNFNQNQSFAQMADESSLFAEQANQNAVRGSNRASIERANRQAQSANVAPQSFEGVFKQQKSGSRPTPRRNPNLNR